MIGQVVVGIDGSEHSLSAIRYAEHFASKLGCELKAVFVIDSRKTELPIIYATGHFDYAFARTYIPPDPELKSFYTKIKTDLEERLEDLRRETQHLKENGSGTSRKWLAKLGLHDDQ